MYFCRCTGILFLNVYYLELFFVNEKNRRKFFFSLSVRNMKFIFSSQRTKVLES